VYTYQGTRTCTTYVVDALHGCASKLSQTSTTAWLGCAHTPSACASALDCVASESHRSGIGVWSSRTAARDVCGSAQQPRGSQASIVLSFVSTIDRARVRSGSRGVWPAGHVQRVCQGGGAGQRDDVPRRGLLFYQPQGMQGVRQDGRWVHPAIPLLNEAYKTPLRRSHSAAVHAHHTLSTRTSTQ
jgi:hypothetical protein